MVARRSIGPGGYIIWGVYYLVLGVLHVPFALLSVSFCVGCMGPHLQQCFQYQEADNNHCILQVNSCAAVLKMYPEFVRVSFACIWEKRVQILAKRPLSQRGYIIWGV